MMNIHGHKASCDIFGKFLYKEGGIRRHEKQEHGINIFDPDKWQSQNSHDFIYSDYFIPISIQF